MLKTTSELRTILIIVTLLMFTSCNDKKNRIYIITTSVTGTDQNQIRKDTTSTVESEYFEVKLSSVNNGELYIAGKQLLKPQIGITYKSEFFKLVDDKGNELQFKTPTDFLNFMYAAGYEMKDQDNQKYGIDYTFKKII
ncbi:hypothetical protein GCM10022289_34290 [Pedobacter jeongneungensis]|uniref:Lipoprotein n=1 Tax=Pedobacter jeongneungensis TaxID=947309 RepID=A0ABP8BKJ4_9SPHI